MIGFKSEKVQAFFETRPKRSYPKGQILLMPGDHVEQAYYIAKGTVKAYTLSYKGDQVVFNNFTARTFFPMSAIINGTPNNYYYQATSDIEVHTATPEELLAFIKDDNKLLLSFLGQTHLALERHANKMNRLMSGNARDLIIFDLLTEFRANGTVDADGQYVVHISEHELGARAGLTRETVSREINKLKELGLLKTNRGRVILLDIMGLESRLQNFA